MAEFEYEDTEQVVCPWCGYQYTDSGEFADLDNTYCEECGEPFYIHRIIDVTYDTERIES